MTKFTEKEMGILTDEIIYLSRNLNNDVIFDLDSSCNNLKNLFQDVRFGYNTCEKIYSLNCQVHDLQNDTFDVCNKIKALLSDVEIVSSRRDV